MEVAFIIGFVAGACGMAVINWIGDRVILRYLAEEEEKHK